MKIYKKKMTRKCWTEQLIDFDGDINLSGVMFCLEVRELSKFYFMFTFFV